MPIMNLIMSAAIYVSGCAISKALRLFDFLKVRIVTKFSFTDKLLPRSITLHYIFQLRHVSESGLYRHAQRYIVPHILNVWQLQQKSLCQQAGNNKLTLLGDGRSDSPGHCAKFGTYTLLNADNNKVMAIELVQVSWNNTSMLC